jgi:hypothetical protein
MLAGAVAAMLATVVAWRARQAIPAIRRGSRAAEHEQAAGRPRHVEAAQ